jgi:hypothetical protein
MVFNQMKGQEEIKASINESLKSLSEQMSHITNIEKLQEVYMLVSAMPQLIEGSLRNLQNDLQNTTKEMHVRYGNDWLLKCAHFTHNKLFFLRL